MQKMPCSFPGTGFFFYLFTGFPGKRKLGLLCKAPSGSLSFPFYPLPALVFLFSRCAYPHRNHLHQISFCLFTHEKRQVRKIPCSCSAAFLFSYHGSSFSPGSSFITSISPSVKESGSPSTLRRLFSWRMRRLSPPVCSRQSRLLIFSA